MNEKQERLVRYAEKIVKKSKLPQGLRLVVVVADEEWAGVSSSAAPPKTKQILQAALSGAHHYEDEVIEVSGEEVPERPLLEARRS